MKGDARCDLQCLVQDEVLSQYLGISAMSVDSHHFNAGEVYYDLMRSKWRFLARF